MGKWIFFFGLFFSFSFGGIAHASAQTSVGPEFLTEGYPGCWDKFHGGPMTASEINAMSVPCQNFRSDYFASIDLAQKNPGLLEKKLIKTLTDAKKANAPYEAIFLAELIHTDKLKGALQKRAEVEKKLHVLNPYAEIAMYRLGGNDCGANPNFVKLLYEEVCEGSDTILPTYFETLAKPTKPSKRSGRSG